MRAFQSHELVFGRTWPSEGARVYARVLIYDGGRCTVTGLRQLERRPRRPAVGWRTRDWPGLSCSPAMSFALLYAVVRFLLDALLTRRQSASRLQAEVLALRHQL